MFAHDASAQRPKCLADGAPLLSLAGMYGTPAALTAVGTLLGHAVAPDCSLEAVLSNAVHKRTLQSLKVCRLLLLSCSV